MGRNKEGAHISDIRIKEDFKPKTKDVEIKTKSAVISDTAKRQMIRQLISTGQGGENADPSMQEVDHAAAHTADTAHSATEKGRAAFQRLAQKRRQVKAEQKQIAARFSHDPSYPSYQSNPTGTRNQPNADLPELRQPATGSKPEIRSRQTGSDTAPKQKPATTLKTRSGSSATPTKAASGNSIKTAGGAAQPKTRNLQKSAAGAKKAATERGRRKLQHDAQRKLAVQAKQAAKRAAEAAEKAAVAIAKAIKAIISALAAGGVGVVLLAVFILIAMIAAVVASPFGVFFSSGGPDTVPLSAAVAEINAEYCGKLMLLQTGDYDEIVIEGSPPDWVDVVAIFACATASDEADAMDVATLDRLRDLILKDVFWSMCEITSEEQTVEHPDPTPDDDVDDSYTTNTLIIHISGKTAEDMRAELDFDEYQNSALDSMLEERESLRGLLGDLTISDEAASELWHNLPPGLSNERKQVIRHALSLVGKVNYFWGGKSLVIGWDTRWGQMQKVRAEGSQTTGTYRPYGLDCSGFVDWVFYNASNGEYVLGHGGGAASQHAYCTEISWDEAQPGDLVFYSDDSHVGIVGGRDENGNLQIIHCNAGANNVSISGISSFSHVGRPDYYG